jgi:DNA-binding beta-propeller fold protein YncE
VTVRGVAACRYRTRRGPGYCRGVGRPSAAAFASVTLTFLALVAAACGAGNGAAGPEHRPSASAPGRSAAGARVLRSPGCTSSVTPAAALPASDVTMARPRGAPFGVAVTPDGRWAFVALGATVGVYRTAGRQLPSLVRQIAMPSGDSALGLALARRYLLVADDQSGAAVISVRAAETGAGKAVVGVLTARPATDGGAIEVAIAPDGRYAFVSNEDQAYVAVFDLQRALADRFGPAGYVGAILTGEAPVGLAMSPNGGWLYVTSEAQSPVTSTGSLTVVNVARAEAYPAGSVAATVPAGCNPVRVITSASGSVVWVSVRGSDALLAFSAARLRTDPGRALIAATRVGELPTALALVRGGSLVVVADSDRYNTPGATSNLAVVDVADALGGRPALLGYLPAGGFPREMALEPGGRTLLVANSVSGQLEAVDVATLP